MKPRASYQRAGILRQLDDSNQKWDFPVLDSGKEYLADVRLTAFRDEKRWAVAIERLVFFPRSLGHRRICNFVYNYGNCLRGEPGVRNDDVLFVTNDGPDGPTFEPGQNEYLRPGAKTIRIRDTVVQLDLRPKSLLAKGIKLKRPPKVHISEMLRSLIPEHRNLLLANEEELRRRIPADLSQILRLEEWTHPDILDHEQPSGSETFHMIADVLVTGNASRYRPTEPPNTHWSNWPMGGDL